MISINSITEKCDIYTPQYFLQGDVCRLCWSKNAERDISSNSSKNDGEVKNSLVTQIRYCLDIDLTEESTLNKVCLACFDNIEKYYNFKLFCTETDKKLREILGKDIATIEENPDQKSFEVKVENFYDFSNIELSEPNNEDSFLCNLESDANIDVAYPEKRKKKKYKAKRGPTYCNICRIDYENEESFVKHNSESHGVENNGLFKCFGCDKQCISRKSRLSHEINFCKGLKDGYKCGNCIRYLPNRKMYEKHMRDHRDNADIKLPEDIFKCLKCYKLFKTKDSLKKHKTVHNSDKKNFICESCGRVFTRQDYLHKHKLTHSGLKQHVCPHCSYRTTQRSSLIVHIRKHTGERPYSCDVCPQRCVSSSNLRAHRRRHLGLNKYECTICSKKFGYKISLQEHVESSHERSQSYPCEHCGAIYTRLRGLRRHLLAKHGKESKESKTAKPEESTAQTTDLYLKIVSENEKVNAVKDVYELKESETFVIRSTDQVFVM